MRNRRWRKMNAFVYWSSKMDDKNCTLILSFCFSFWRTTPTGALAFTNGLHCMGTSILRFPGSAHFRKFLIHPPVNSLHCIILGTVRLCIRLAGGRPMLFRRNNWMLYMSTCFSSRIPSHTLYMQHRCNYGGVGSAQFKRRHPIAIFLLSIVWPSLEAAMCVYHNP